MHDAYVELIFGLLAAIVLVYLLIVVNFQSWLDPFIIITALPGALAGIAWALFLTHTRLSVPALTGAIMTMGTATANSILVVSYARERLARARRRAAGRDRSRKDPLPSGAHDRFGHDHRDGAHGDGIFPECAAGSRRHRRLTRCHIVHPVFRALRVRHDLQPANGSPKGAVLMMQDLAWKSALPLSAILLCVLYFGYRIYESRSDAAALREETLEDAIPTVAVINPKPVPPTETITLPGNIQAWFQAPIYAQVSGYVKMWYKDYGALVKKGDILAEINAPALDAQYAQAKADLESERAKYALADMTAKRWVALRKNHAVSEQSISVQVANAKAQAARVKAAEQNVRNFEALIRFKTIVAPYDGVVTDRNINVGDYVNKEGRSAVPPARSATSLPWPTSVCCASLSPCRSRSGPSSSRA